MRRFLITSLTAFALIISATGAAPAVHAQQNFVTPEAGQQPNFVTPGATGNAGVSSLYTSLDNPLNASGAAGTGAVTTSISNPGGGNTGSGQVTNPDFSGDTSEQFGSIMTWIMSLFAWLVGVAALLLDYSVYFTVVSMGSYVNKLAAVGVTWRILRDVANIMLIFGFLAIGVSTILGIDWYGGAKKLLPKLVFAAVALNFSLFVCEAMIDGTNLIATQFYQQINAGNPVTQETLSNTTVGWFGSGQLGNEPISNAIMGQLGLQTVYNINVNKDAAKGDHSWFIVFMGIILFMVTAFVLFSLALILIARFVALIFFILLSPVGFMGIALPLMEGRAKQWWENFLAQIITAPVLLLLLYVALAIITDAQFLTGFNASSEGWLGLNSSNFVGFAGMLLSFLVAIGFLMIVVIKARSMAAFGAGWATKTAGSVAFGATAFGLRSTVGLGSQWASQRIRRSGAGATKTGRVLATAFDRGATGSFDIRGTKALKVFPGGGIDAGAAQKGGYRARLEASTKAHVAYVGTLEERKMTKEEEERIRAATAEHAAATMAHGEVSAARDLASKEVEAKKAELDRLEKEDQRRKQFHTPTLPEEQRQLDEARKNLATSEATLATASASLTEASKKLSTAATAKAAVKESVESAVSKKNQKEAYATNIQGPFFGNSVPGWVAFGPGGAKAAEKIKNAAKDKTQAQKLNDIIEEAAKKKAEELAKKDSAEAKPAEEGNA